MVLLERAVLGDEYERKDATVRGAIVRCQSQETKCADIGKRLDSSNQVTRLALVSDDRGLFVLGEDLIMRKRRLDGAVDLRKRKPKAIGCMSNLTRASR